MSDLLRFTPESAWSDVPGPEELIEAREWSKGKTGAHLRSEQLEAHITPLKNNSKPGQFSKRAQINTTQETAGPAK